MIIEGKIHKNIISFILILITYRDIFQITNSQLWYFFVDNNWVTLLTEGFSKQYLFNTF